MPSDDVKLNAQGVTGSTKVAPMAVSHGGEGLSADALKQAVAAVRELTLADIAAGTPYPPDAFLFLQRGLAATVEKLYGTSEVAGEEPCHVHGRDLCLGLRRLAQDEWGLLAGLVLSHWNVRETADFGRMVYALVEHQVLAVSDDDRPQDFEDVYDFATAF